MSATPSCAPADAGLALVGQWLTGSIRHAGVAVMKAVAAKDRVGQWPQQAVGFRDGQYRHPRVAGLPIAGGLRRRRSAANCSR
ncbi:hypothetical protein I552_3177 [Mycobacterium xenopi 3993]|nr:hypothetical protein I552_3177 [Mycobacterium xenopi 3993]